MLDHYEHGIYSEEERIAMENFNKFAEIARKFTHKKESEYGSFYDAIAWSKGNMTNLIELKGRNADIENYKDCFIEIDKYGDLSNQYLRYHVLPLYINFIGDWRNVYIWVIPQLVGVGTCYFNKYIEGTYEPRIGLPWNQAYHFVYNEATGKYKITKPSKQMELQFEIVRSEPDMVLQSNKIDNKTFEIIWKKRKQELN